MHITTIKNKNDIKNNKTDLKNIEKINDTLEELKSQITKIRELQTYSKIEQIEHELQKLNDFKNKNSLCIYVKDKE